MPAATPMPRTPLDRWRRYALWLTLVATLILGLGLSWHTTGDLDLPLHDRVGRDLLAGRGIPATNQFSFTAPDHPWVDHEWAFQAVTALAGSLGGGDGFADRVVGWHYLRVLLTGLLLVLLLHDLRQGSRHRPAIAAYLGPAILVTLAMLWTRLTLRPELVSYALLVLVLRRIEAAITAPPATPWWRDLIDPRRAGGQVLLLTLIWYQMHGFAIIAPLLWILAAVLQPPTGGRADHWRRCATGAALGLLAGLATPSGVAGLLYPLRALGQFGAGADLQHTISELVPLLETRGSLALTLVVFQVSLVWGLVVVVAGWGRRSRLRTALWVLAAIAAWNGQRNLGIYAVAFLLLHAGPTRFEDAAAPWSRWLGRLPERSRQLADRFGAVVVPVATWVLIGIWLVALAGDTFYLREGVARRWGRGLTPANYPEAAAATVTGSASGRIANTVDAASTLVALGGQVAIDGRTEAYPVAAWRAYAEFKRGGESTRSRLRSWAAGAVCLAHRNPAAQAVIATLLEDAEWALVAADQAGVAFLPRDQASGPVDGELLRRQSRVLHEELAASPESPVRRADRAAAWASLLVLAGDTVGAEDFLVLARTLHPDHPVVLHNHGNLLMARGEFRGALRDFEAAARLNRNAAPPLVNAGNCLFQLGRVDDAAAAFEAAVGRDAANFEGWANLAELRRRAGDRNGARRAYEKALALRPDDRRLRARAQSL